MNAGSVAGFDLTFKAPKRVSILFGVAPSHIRLIAAECHEAAVNDALAYVTAPNDFLNDRSPPILDRDELVDLVTRGFESEPRQELAIEALETSAPTPPAPDLANHGFDMGM